MAETAGRTTKLIKPKGTSVSLGTSIYAQPYPKSFASGKVVWKEDEIFKKDIVAAT